MAGATQSFGAGGWDIWVLKLDSNGNVTWQKTYGGSDWDAAYSIPQTIDGGYIVAGKSWSFGAGLSDYWILKLDGNGDVTWQKTYGGSSYGFAHSIQQTAKGGYIVAGATQSFGAGDRDFWVHKLDSNGNVSWQKTYGGNDEENVYSIQQTAEGGYIVAGYTYSFGAGISDGWMLKLDNSGNVSWQKTYGGGDYERAWSTRQTTDGGYIVAGETKSFGAGGDDMWILKLASNGDITDCDMIGTSNAIVSDTSVSGVNTSVTGQPTSSTITNTVISPQDTSAEITTVCEGGVFNNSPNIPIDPWPAVGATGVTIAPTLSWDGGDPDGAGDTVDYLIYLNDSECGSPIDPTTFIGTVEDVPGDEIRVSYTTYLSGPSLCSCYYWKVVARDSQGAEVSGPVWCFRITGGCSTCPSAPPCQ